tara:strand:+ start:87 stop:302 length:216 start_codon:yes stop_codon:yes gene_type:complete
MYEKIELIISEYKLNRITKEKCLIELKNHIKQIIKLNYTHCCTELKCGECDCKPKYPNIGADTLKDCKKEW